MLGINGESAFNIYFIPSIIYQHILDIKMPRTFFHDAYTSILGADKIYAEGYTFM